MGPGATGPNSADTDRGRSHLSHPAYRRLAPHTHRPPQAPTRPDVCGRCDAPAPCCHCGADVVALRRFATRMAVIHQPTGMPVCGCGTHNCYVRKRLEGISGRGWAVSVDTHGGDGDRDRLVEGLTSLADVPIEVLQRTVMSGCRDAPTRRPGKVPAAPAATAPTWFREHLSDPGTAAARGVRDGPETTEIGMPHRRATVTVARRWGPSSTQARCHSVGCVTDRGAAGETRERDQAGSNHVPTSMALRSGPPVRRMKLAGQPSTLTRLAMPHREPVVSSEPSTRHTSSVTSSPGPTFPTGLNGSQMVVEVWPPPS